jgi:hypothetical protein
MFSLQEHGIATIHAIFTSLLVLVCTGLALKLKHVFQRNVQLKMELANVAFALDLAEQSVSILESELERKTFTMPVKTLRTTDERKIPAHYGDSKEKIIQNYLEDSGSMIIQEELVGRWINNERKLSSLEEELKELHRILNSSGKLPKSEIFKTSLFLVDKMLDCSYD